MSSSSRVISRVLRGEAGRHATAETFDLAPCRRGRATQKPPVVDPLAAERAAGVPKRATRPPWPRSALGDEAARAEQAARLSDAADRGGRRRPGRSRRSRVGASRARGRRTRLRAGRGVLGARDQPEPVVSVDAVKRAIGPRAPAARTWSSGSIPTTSSPRGAPGPRPRRHGQGRGRPRGRGRRLCGRGRTLPDRRADRPGHGPGPGADRLRWRRSRGGRYDHRAAPAALVAAAPPWRRVAPAGSPGWSACASRSRVSRPPWATRSGSGAAAASSTPRSSPSRAPPWPACPSATSPACATATRSRRSAGPCPSSWARACSGGSSTASVDPSTAAPR